MVRTLQDGPLRSKATGGCRYTMKGSNHSHKVTNRTTATWRRRAVRSARPPRRWRPETTGPAGMRPPGTSIPPFIGSTSSLWMAADGPIVNLRMSVSRSGHLVNFNSAFYTPAWLNTPITLSQQTQPQAGFSITVTARKTPGRKKKPRLYAGANRWKGLNQSQGELRRGVA